MRSDVKHDVVRDSRMAAETYKQRAQAGLSAKMGFEARRHNKGKKATVSQQVLRLARLFYGTKRFCQLSLTEPDPELAQNFNGRPCASSLCVAANKVQTERDSPLKCTDRCEILLAREHDRP